jgi:hypothetical protein
MQLCLMLATCSLLAAAQGTGRISGKVEDVSGCAIAGASVSASDLTSGVVVRTKTADDGQFHLSGLAPDRYLATVEKTGFNAYVAGISLATQPSVNVEAELTVLPGARPNPLASRYCNRIRRSGYSAGSN